MNDIDILLKYIYGDLSEKERDAVELKLTIDPNFAKLLSDIQNTLDLVHKILTVEDISQEESREQIMAEVIAQLDLEEYEGKKNEKETKEFVNALDQAMNSSGSGKNVKNNGGRRLRYMLYTIAAAASMALLFIPGRTAADLAANWYDPEMIFEDTDLFSPTRGEDPESIIHFRNGNYLHARNILENNEVEGTAEPVEALIYALTLYQTGKTEQSIELLKELSGGEELPVVYHSLFYLSLIQINEGNDLEAAEILQRLKKMNGIHDYKIRRLLRSVDE